MNRKNTEMATKVLLWGMTDPCYIIAVALWPKLALSQKTHLVRRLIFFKLPTMVFTSEMSRLKKSNKFRFCPSDSWEPFWLEIGSPPESAVRPRSTADLSTHSMTPAFLRQRQTVWPLATNLTNSLAETVAVVVPEELAGPSLTPVPPTANRYPAKGDERRQIIDL